MRKLMMAAASAALMAYGAGTANATEGWYGRLDAGYSTDGKYKQDVDTSTEVILPEATNTASLDLNEDWMFSGGIGYAFKNNFRLEAELANRQNDISNTPFSAEATSLMGNLFYDFNRGGGWEPYVGLGAGAAKLDVGPDNDSAFAWQALAGVAIPLGERFDIDVGYRYFEIPDAKLFNQSADYTHQAVTIGLRYQFTPPPAPMVEAPPAPPPAPPTPPPPPPPAACPTQSFVVYFAWDHSDLNQEAMDTINAAMERARQCNLTGTVVVGHTDTSGSNAYNQRLSERRAGIVRDALVSRGMPASVITTEAHGETDLAKPTHDGVREPLNRRTSVTITFH